MRLDEAEAANHSMSSRVHTSLQLELPNPTTRI